MSHSIQPTERPVSRTEDESQLTGALLYWCHPSENYSQDHPLLQMIQVANAKPASLHSNQDTAILRTFNRRWTEWQVAFRSVYYLFRHEQVEYFYLQFPTFSILFTKSSATSLHSASSTGIGTTSHHICSPVAIISRSTKAYRKQLSTKGVSFSLPLSKRKERVAEEDDQESSDEQWNAKGIKVKKGLQDQVSNGDLDSLCVVRGRQQVHALFDVLINPIKRAGDVPRILSPGPFMNCSVQSLHVTKNGPTAPTRSGQNTKGAAGAVGGTYALDLQGPIIPSSLISLCHLLSRTQRQGESRGRDVHSPSKTRRMLEIRLWDDSTTGSANINA